MDQIINSYYANGAKKLHIVVDQVLFKLKFFVDKEDFYSLATEVFLKALNSYDSSQSFDNFFYSCLSKKFKTEMTRRNRFKRCNVVEVWEENERGEIVKVKKYIPDVSIYEKTSVNSTQTWEDIICNISNEDNDTYQSDDLSEKMNAYLKQLSSLQKDVLFRIADGYKPEAIKSELHITEKQYQDCWNAIHSYRNVKILC